MDRAITAARESRLANPERGWLDEVVNLDRYPLNDERALSALAAEVHGQLAANGASVLPGFLRADALHTLASELEAAASHVPIYLHEGTVYARRDLEGQLERNDPRCIRQRWYAGHITRDMIPPYSGAQQLYVSPIFKRFIAQCAGRDRVFEYADPLAGLVTTVLPPGGQYPWHYDTNEYVVTIMIQQPTEGGRFEYHTDLRSPSNENLEGLGRVLAGDRTGVRETNNGPGDLQLFRGRYSLHQVTQTEGQRDRLVLVLSYADQPGLIGPVDRTRNVYGRVTEAHLVAAESRQLGGDGLIL